MLTLSTLDTCNTLLHNNDSFHSTDKKSQLLHYFYYIWHIYMISEIHGMAHASKIIL